MRTFLQKQTQSQGSSSFARSNTATHGPADVVQRHRTPGGAVGFDFSRIRIFPPAEGAIQAKLAISQPGDQYEQEADRVSEQVMGHTCACGGTCSKCRSQHSVPKGDDVHTKRVDANSRGPAVVLPTVQAPLHSPGRPLDAPTRTFMEPRFGHDFSGVRIHTDNTAEDGARAVGARAYTLGRDIVFGAGEYAPTTVEGRRLLAHELAHVVQQETFAPPMIARQPAAAPVLGPIAQVKADLASIKVGLRGANLIDMKSHKNHAEFASTGFLAWTNSSKEIYIDLTALQGAPGPDARAAALIAVRHEIEHVIQFTTNGGPPKNFKDMISFESQAYPKTIVFMDNFKTFLIKTIGAAKEFFDATRSSLAEEGTKFTGRTKVKASEQEHKTWLIDNEFLPKTIQNKADYAIGDLYTL